MREYGIKWKKKRAGMKIEKTKETEKGKGKEKKRQRGQAKYPGREQGLDKTR